MSFGPICLSLSPYSSLLSFLRPPCPVDCVSSTCSPLLSPPLVAVSAPILSFCLPPIPHFFSVLGMFFSRRSPDSIQDAGSLSSSLSLFATLPASRSPPSLSWRSRSSCFAPFLPPVPFLSGLLPPALFEVPCYRSAPMSWRVPSHADHLCLSRLGVKTMSRIILFIEGPFTFFDPRVFWIPPADAL